MKSPKSRYIVTVALIVAVVMLLLSTGKVWASNWKITNTCAALQCDSIRLTIYQDGTAIGTAKNTNRQCFDTIITAATGRLTVAEFAYWFVGYDSAALGVYYNDQKTDPSATESWLVRMKTADACDSIRLKIYTDTTLDTTEVDDSVQSWSGTYDATRGARNTAAFNIWFQGADSMVGYSLVWDLSDTTTQPVPSDANYSYVQGYIRYRGQGGGGANDRVYGAKVIAIPTESKIASDTTGTSSVILSGLAVETTTDTLGFFRLELLATSAYDDTTRGFYNIVARSNTGVDIFNLPKLHIPANTTVDLGEIISTR